MATLVLAGAKRLPPGEELFEKCLAASGGYARYQRLETLSYDFVRKSAGGAAERGRHSIRLHDARGLRIREEVRAPGGDTVTVVTSSGVWRTEGGKRVEDPEALRRAGEALAAEALWALAPGYFKEGACPVTYLGKGHLGGKLSPRLSVGRGAVPVDRWFAAPDAAVTLFVDETSRLLEGAEFAPPTGGGTRIVVFGLHAERQGHVVPLQRDFLDRDGNRTGSFSLTGLELNGYLDEGLFGEP